MAEERSLHDAKLKKMEAEMKMVFQQKVNEKESKLKQSEEELYARHREMKDALEKQRKELEEKSGLRAPSDLSVSSHADCLTYPDCTPQSTASSLAALSRHRSRRRRVVCSQGVD